MRRSIWMLTVVGPLLVAAIGIHFSVCRWGVTEVGRPLLALEGPPPPGGFVRNTWTGILHRTAGDSGGGADQAMAALAGVGVPLGLLSFAAVLVDRRIRTTRKAEGRCIACGFVLDVDRPGRCPECGAVTASGAAAPAAG